MNRFCGMAERGIAFNLIYSWDICQMLSPPKISDKLRAGLQPAQNLISGIAEISCAVLITTTPSGTENSSDVLLFQRKGKYLSMMALFSVNIFDFQYQTDM